jgi:phosphoribosylformylglycinamidine synthase
MPPSQTTIQEPPITDAVIKEHGFTPDEYRRILDILGRTPTFTELGIFSVMWSEHCSYKSSRLHLKGFPTEAPWVVQGPGENAGVIDIGGGLVAVFKMESHNHPSYIEPYQGAATGVGGILRDVFTMGARPVASLNSLRFGPLDDPYQRYLFGGVVSGIAGYGNCIGVPTIGGEIYCHPSYAGNILVNAFNLGIAEKDLIFYGKAQGVGNLIIYVGSKTGIDGIHGVTMASEEFSNDAQQKRPNVQIGDPFTEKLLLEACLEVMKLGLVVGIQDMGGAGLTSSSAEMAGRAGTGVEMELEKVPLRNENMRPYEIMLSESQERMLLVVEEKDRDAVVGIFKKWGLDAAVIGRVTSDGMLRVKWHGRTMAEIPAAKISDDAPLYDRPSARPDRQDELNRLNLADVPELKSPEDCASAFLTILASPCIASKELVWQEYDHMVRTDTIVPPGSDAAVIRVKGTGKAIAMSVDCNSRYCYLDPYIGGLHAVSEAARNVACSGAVPLAVTDCLNFGNPEKPDVMWQFKEAVRGISDACRALDTPVVSGNVSLYNETRGAAIYPTPTVGVVGVLQDASLVMTQGFKREGDVIIVIGQTGSDLGGSEYLSVRHGLEKGMPPAIDMARERALQTLVIELCKRRLIRSAHDCSDGGMAVALAESCISGKIGADVDLSPVAASFLGATAAGVRLDAVLFSETASRVIISAEPEHTARIFIMCKDAGLWAAEIGTCAGNYGDGYAGDGYAGGRFSVRLHGAVLLNLDMLEVSDIYNNALSNALGRAPSA